MVSEIEKMKRYIERTKQPRARAYQMSTMEMLEFAKATAETPIDAVVMAFNYGSAKGYRSANAERKAVKA